jgi:hypothetical protein
MLVQGMLCSNKVVVSTWQSHYRYLNKSENFLGKIKKIFQPEWFVQQSATWNNNYEVQFREVLAKRGYGFAFNMMQDYNMFTEKLSRKRIQDDKFIQIIFFLLSEFQVIFSEQNSSDFNQLTNTNSKIYRRIFIL